MYRYLLVLLCVLLLTSCGEPDYEIISSDPVDGYHIYLKERTGLFCGTYYEDVYYSGEVYNYGFRFRACDPSMAVFIKSGDSYIYLQTALDQGLITMESLLPELQELIRQPEEIESDEADYYWLDFHIGGHVVYAYAGGECDMATTETFVIDGASYGYSATGCLKEHILYMEIDHEYTPIADLIDNGTIDPTYLIPLLVPIED